mgnify:CR=1 FL=1
MTGTESRSVGVFIDGGYYAKVDAALKKMASKSISLKGLFDFILDYVCKMDSLRKDKVSITEAHYYRGRYRVNDASSKHLLFEERKFEDTLIENDVIFHYKHLRPNPSGGVIEKGVDTWFALDTYEMTLYRQFDYVVLISGDADHEMLARKLKALKTHTILLTWDPANTGSTSRFLSEEVCTHIDMMRQAGKEPDLMKKVTIQK